MVIPALTARRGNLSWEAPEIPEKALGSKEKSGTLSLCFQVSSHPSAHTPLIPEAIQGKTAKTQREVGLEKQLRGG